jgi:YHS domain-containing protein
MKRIVVICLVAFLVLSLGCGKKESQEENAQQTETSSETVAKGPTQGGLRASLIDPVSKQPVDIETSPYSYIYKDTEFYFENEENMKAFMKEPEKFLEK